MDCNEGAYFQTGWDIMVNYTTEALLFLLT